MDATDIGTLAKPPLNASQGVSFWQIIAALKPYLMLITDLPDTKVKFWWHEASTQAGEDLFVWIRPILDDPDLAKGMNRFGNRSTLKIETHLIARSFVDQAQVDERRAKDYLNTYFKLENAIQGKNLFNSYIAPTIVNNVWISPQPAPKKAFPLTIEPMYLSPIPNPKRTAKEEGTIDTAFVINLPVVLALTLP